MLATALCMTSTWQCTFQCPVWSVLKNNWRIDKVQAVWALMYVLRCLIYYNFNGSCMQVGQRFSMIAFFGHMHNYYIDEIHSLHTLWTIKIGLFHFSRKHETRVNEQKVTEFATILLVFTLHSNIQCDSADIWSKHCHQIYEMQVVMCINQCFFLYLYLYLAHFYKIPNNNTLKTT